MNRQVCERCKKENAMVFSYTKWLCGECFMRIKTELDAELNKRIMSI